jgi:hypothetical protein
VELELALSLLQIIIVALEYICRASLVIHQRVPENGDGGTVTWSLTCLSPATTHVAVNQSDTVP